MRRCTDVLQSIDGLALDICTAGPYAALHISTQAGRVVVRLPRAEVAAKFLSGVDANGCPLAAGPSVTERLVADAQATAPHRDEAAPRPSKPHRKTSAEARAACERVWAELDGGSLKPIKDLAARHGVTTAQIYFFVNRHRRERWAQLLKRRCGKASQAELAAMGFPLTKPSSATL